MPELLSSVDPPHLCAGQPLTNHPQFMAGISKQQAEQANDEAAGSRRQARLSTLLALVATVYLPITSVSVSTYGVKRSIWIPLG